MAKSKRLNPVYGNGEMFGRLWRSYLRKHTVPIVLASVLMVIEGSTLGVLSWMLKPTFDLVFVGGQADAIWWVGLGIFGLFVLRATTGVAQKFIMAKVSNKTSAEMQTDLLKHVLTLDNSFFQATSPGVLISRISSDTRATQNIWSALITGAGRDAISLLSLFTVALMVDPIWTMVALIGTPLLILPNLMLQRYIAAARVTRLDEIFHGVTSVKLNALEAYQHRRYASLTSAFVKAQVKMTGISGMMPGVIDIATGLGFFCVIVYGGSEIIAGEKTVGDFMSFFAAMTLAFQPLRRLGSLTGTWQIAAASLERVFQLFDLRPSISGNSSPVVKPDLQDTTIRFENVDLSYGDAEVLRGLTFSAEAGKMTALVGASGAGKSSIFNLLTRLVEVDSGRITIGDQDISKMDLPDLRSLFSVVSQDSLLFDETIRENILVGRKDVPEDVLREAIEAAHASEFIDAMPVGLETPAGPRGSNLSGGQRQRIAIARALLRDAPILLLDEATSALDAALEAQVQDAIETLSKGRTVLVIAHHMSVVARADQIIVLNQGQTEDQGTEAELLVRGGLFANLHALQLRQK